jgi:hypothetical protein
VDSTYYLPLLPPAFFKGVSGQTPSGFFEPIGFRGGVGARGRSVVSAAWVLAPQILFMTEKYSKGLGIQTLAPIGRKRFLRTVPVLKNLEILP